MKKLREIRLSTLADNFLCLCVADETDYLLVTPRKTEIVTCLVDVAHAALQAAPAVVFENWLELRHKGADGGRSAS